MKYRMIFLKVLKLFEEPMSESNTERRVKCQPVFQEKAHKVISPPRSSLSHVSVL